MNVKNYEQFDSIFWVSEDLNFNLKIAFQYLLVNKYCLKTNNKKKNNNNSKIQR